MTEVLAERKILWFGQPKTVRVVRKHNPRSSTPSILLAYWIENGRATLIPDEWCSDQTLALRTTRTAVIDAVAHTIAGFMQGPE